MQIRIGQRLSRTGVFPIAATVGLLAAAADLLLVWWNQGLVSIEDRWAIAVAVLGAYSFLGQGDGRSIGLVHRPSQNWGYWVRAALLMGVVVAAVLVAFGTAWVLSGRSPPIYSTPPDRVGSAFLQMCVFAPLLEETIYRLAICVSLAGVVGPWGAIFASGLLFGALHLLYGNPSPENLLGGFVLAWAFLKSESIVVPMLLHGLGNLCVLLARIGAWYWLQA